METSFNALNLIEPLQKALATEGYTTATPIQAKAIPHLLEGKDLLGIAQTGTGKTAAFSLPLLQKLATDKRIASRGAPRALILAPTRELAAQIGDSLKAYGKNLFITHTVVFGGVGQNPQVQALQRGVDIVVATPGRLLDLMNQGHIRLDAVEVFVLDEADRMLDMGFIKDVKKIVAKLPAKRHTLFFSATMPKEVADLAKQILVMPVEVEITPQATTVEKIQQHLYFVSKADKNDLLIELLQDPSLERVLIFTRTKHVANKVSELLNKKGIKADAIHGNKSQNARTLALTRFKGGKIRALVATDIAARGIDIDNITHVINYELPNEPESYVHRIGRTARAGAEGVAYSFCAPDERDFLRGIEKAIRMTIPVVKHARHSKEAQEARGADARPPPKQFGRGRPQRSGQQHKPSGADRAAYGALRSQTSVKGHGKRPMRRY